jgi:hypothetical protein
MTRVLVLEGHAKLPVWKKAPAPIYSDSAEVIKGPFTRTKKSVSHDAA